MPLALSWRIIRDGSLPGARNMALDHALARGLGPDQGVLRLYSWARPTVSFGRNEPARCSYSREAAGRLGIDYVRRPTGGRAVLHDAELTYAVIAPIRALGGVRGAYRLINDALAGALRSLGAAVGVAAGASTLGLNAGPCFQSPADGEVVGGGRKLIGSAQARVDGALLQHGSIILSGDQTRLHELAARPGFNHAPDQARLDERGVDVVSSDDDEWRGMHPWHARPATLLELIGEIDTHDVADAVVAGMGATLGGTWAEGVYEARESAEAERLLAERYGRDDWTWRR